MTQDLLSRIVQYEQRLHRFEVRHQKAELEKLLHRDFFEIGRSGKRYDRRQVIDALTDETGELHIQSTQFALTQLDMQTLLLTYTTFVLNASGEKTHHTLRASVWVMADVEGNDWQMRFHQGTPAAD